MSALRDQLAAALKEALPAGRYRIVASLDTLDKISKPTIQLEQSEIERSPSAQGVAMVTINVHVITHREGTTPAADNAIDDLGVEVFEALASIGHVNPTRADKRVYNSTNLSYVIPTQVLTARSTTP